MRVAVLWVGICLIGELAGAQMAAAQTVGTKTAVTPDAPRGPSYDTSYYKSFKGSIIIRAFLSRNYSILKLNPPGSLPLMKYSANTPLNIGLGFSYRSVSVSVSKGLGFLQSGERKGDTHSFDLQAHVYKRKWTIDGLAQFYKGYYLSDPGLGQPGLGGPFYLRPDMQVQTVGLSVCRVLNDRRFSYGAGLAQNAIQEKSAGSFLIGGNALYTAVHADSALAPYKIDTLYNREDIAKTHLFEIGVGFGYAYTYVFEKHYFLLGSATVNLDAYFSRELGSGIKSDKIGLSPDYFVHLGAGYNARRWGLSAVWFTGGVSAMGERSGYRYGVHTGSYRLVYARRLAINRKMKGILEGNPVY